MKLKTCVLCDKEIAATEQVERVGEDYGLPQSKARLMHKTCADKARETLAAKGIKTERQEQAGKSQQN